MRRKIWLFIAVFCLLTGCAKETTTPSPLLTYDDFKAAFTTFKEQFNPSQFEKISPEHPVVITTSFPENNLDTREADIVGQTAESPARYETYYKAKHSDVFVKVNFIYFPASQEKQFVTLHSISPEDNSNIVEEYRTIPRPFLNEYLLAMEGYLVLINFIDGNHVSAEKAEEYSKSFIADCLAFFEEFEQSLLHIHQEIFEKRTKLS